MKKWTAVALVLLALAGSVSFAGKGGNGNGGGKPGGGDEPPADPAIAYFQGDSLKVMNEDGSNQTRILRGVPGSGQDVAWSADGSRLAIQATFDGPGIYTVNVDGSGLTKIASTATQYTGKPVWSPVAAPDGEFTILFEDDAGGNRDVFAVRADGSDRINLTNTAGVNEVTPTWSPDATRFAAIVGFDAGAGWGYDVFVFDLGVVGGLLSITGTTNVTEGTSIEHSDLGPGLDWARTQNRLAVARYDAGGNQYDLWIIDLGTSTTVTNLTATSDVSERQPTWSPDDAKLAFWRDTGGRSDGIHVLNADGTGLTPLATGGRREPRAPDWMR